MTPKQSRFVDEYLIDLNATQACIRAGYSKRNADKIGPELLGHPRVAAAIQDRMNARSKRTEITADYVLHSIVETIERCKQAEPVTDRRGEPVMCETPDGSFVPAYTFNPMGVLKGAELLGKHLKLFTERVDHTSSDGSMSPPRTLADFYAGLVPEVK